MKIAQKDCARTTYEYGCDLRRLFPWRGVANPLWGAAIASVRPSEATVPHSHDEEETFLILGGMGEIVVDGEKQVVQEGDVIYLPRNCHHGIRNLSEKDRLEFLTIFWGSPEAKQRMAEMVLAGSTGE